MTKSFEELLQAKISRRSFLVGSTALMASTLLPNSSKAFQFRKKSERLQLNKLDFPYKYDLLIKWGDLLYQDQYRNHSFGYNNDYIAYMPINGSPEHGLLCVNHETTNWRLMPPLQAPLYRDEMINHGHSTIEIKKENGKWAYIENSKYNRRFDALETEFKISGPATATIGDSVIGTVNNCAWRKNPMGNSTCMRRKL